MQPSLSEDNGISLLTAQDLRVYSVGISTGGVAESRMAELNPNLRVVATTLDKRGAAFAREYIERRGLSQQITVKVEDVSLPLPYHDGSFDFVYARLVLHYLPKKALKSALDELHRILKREGRLFVVVRSSASSEANLPHSIYDSVSGMTAYKTAGGTTHSRYFHTQASISSHLVASGFLIQRIQSYEELLCVDFQRTKVASHPETLIEVLAGIS